MKKLLLIFLMFLSTTVFSEEYNCAGIWNDEVEMKVYTRNGDHFIHNRLGRAEITSETSEILMMHIVISDDSIFIAIINKSNKKFMENFVYLNDPLPTKPLVGNCLVLD